MGVGAEAMELAAAAAARARAAADDRRDAVLPERDESEETGDDDARFEEGRPRGGDVGGDAPDGPEGDEPGGDVSSPAGTAVDIEGETDAGPVTVPVPVSAPAPAPAPGPVPAAVPAAAAFRSPRALRNASDSGLRRAARVARASSIS